MEPCTRCGECCKEALCQAGIMAYGIQQVPCPALIKIAGEYACEIVITEKENQMCPIIASALGIGKGCTNEFKVGFLVREDCKSN